MDILSIIGIIIGVLVLVIVISVVTIQFDLASYTATGVETLTPNGTATGNALVVYTPGITGTAKKAATEIANELKSNGYNVTLAGVRNDAATNTSGYDVIVVGGPMYFGKLSNSMDSYLKTLTLPENAKLGVFGTTGSDQAMAEDLELLEKQVNGKATIIKQIRDSNDQYAAQDYQDLVSALV